MALILFFDSETGGFPIDRLPDDHPSQPPLVQLGMVLVDEENGAEWGTFEAIVKPNGWVVPDSAAKVHGITTEVATLAGIPLSCVVPMFVHFRNRARMIVCHNPKFDLRIMNIAIARNGKPVTLPGPSEVFDTGEGSAKLVGMPPTEQMCRWGRSGQNKTPKLTEAYRFFFGEDYDGAHSALADARACARVYFEVKRREAEAVRSVAPAEACAATDAAPYELKGGEEVRDGKLYGWTGIKHEACGGTGETGDAKRCDGCGGTGEEWGLMPEQPANLPSPSN